MLFAMPWIPVLVISIRLFASNLQSGYVVDLVLLFHLGGLRSSDLGAGYTTPGAPPSTIGQRSGWLAVAELSSAVDHLVLIGMLRGRGLTPDHSAPIGIWER